MGSCSGYCLRYEQTTKMKVRGYISVKNYLSSVDLTSI